MTQIRNFAIETRSQFINIIGKKGSKGTVNHYRTETEEDTQGVSKKS